MFKTKLHVKTHIEIDENWVINEILSYGKTNLQPKVVKFGKFSSKNAANSQF